MENKTLINRSYKFKIGEEVIIHKNYNHTEEKMIGNVIKIYPSFILLKGIPIAKEGAFSYGEPIPYKYTISFNSIGIEGVKVWVDKAA